MLIGNAAANKLDGRAGLDTLIGGAGNDIYFVDDMADVAIENPGEGVDTVIVTATIDFKLGANIENLTVASNVAAGYEVVGNALANKITGTGAGGGLSGDGRQRPPGRRQWQRWPRRRRWRRHHDRRQGPGQLLR